MKRYRVTDLGKSDCKEKLQFIDVGFLCIYTHSDASVVLSSPLLKWLSGVALALWYFCFCAGGVKWVCGARECFEHLLVGLLCLCIGVMC